MKKYNKLVRFVNKYGCKDSEEFTPDELYELFDKKLGVVCHELLEATEAVCKSDLSRSVGSLFHWKGSRKDVEVVVIGKGLTFDTGGLNLKTNYSIAEMHFDKLGAIFTIGLGDIIKHKKVAFSVACADNLIGSQSFRPGSVIKIKDSRYRDIRVIDTDAEGKLV